MCLFAVTCTSPLYIVSYLPLCMLWFCTKYVFVCVVPYMLILCIQVCLFRDIIYLCVFALSLMHLDDILFGSFGVINGSSHFGGVICLGISLAFFKMCVHEYHHLVLLLQDYLVTVWCVILMRNSNSKWPLIISSWILVASYGKQMYITLWGSNMLFVYYKPRKCEHLRNLSI